MQRVSIVLLGLALAACAVPQRVSDADGVASFNKVQLAALDEAGCEPELARARHGQRWWLCGYGWRPASEPGGEKAVESYRVFWVRAASPRIVLRLSRYEDGSGALWATTDDNGKAAPRMQVTTLKPGELDPLFTRLGTSLLWASSYAKLGSNNEEGTGCKAPARWILEGRRPEDRRAVSVQSCGEGRWAIALGEEMLEFARAKIPDLPAAAN